MVVVALPFCISYSLMVSIRCQWWDKRHSTTDIVYVYGWSTHVLRLSWRRTTSIGIRSFPSFRPDVLSSHVFCLCMCAMGRIRFFVWLVNVCGMVEMRVEGEHTHWLAWCWRFGNESMNQPANHLNWLWYRHTHSFTHRIRSMHPLSFSQH